MKLHRKVLVFSIVITCVFLIGSPATQATSVGLDPIYSYEEYLSYIAQNELPENFVPFESLSHFGEFDSFVYLDTIYSYSLIDDANFSMNIAVTQQTDSPLYINKYPLLSRSQVDQGDMRTLPSGGNGRYERAGLTYWYESGTLQFISWSHNDLNITLNTHDSFENYPMHSNTVLAKLLNIQLRSNMELTAILQGNQISPWIYIAAGAVLVIAASAAILLWKRRKKQCSPPK